MEKFSTEQRAALHVAKECIKRPENKMSNLKETPYATSLNFILNHKKFTPRMDDRDVVRQRAAAWLA